MFEDPYRHNFMQKNRMNAGQQIQLEYNYVCSKLTIHIFLHLAQLVKRVLTTALEKKLFSFKSHYRHNFQVVQPIKRVLRTDCGKIYYCSSSTIGIFLYVAHPVERVLATDIAKNIYIFESHSQHISLCSPAIRTRVSSRLWKQSILFLFPISAYFFCSSNS